MGDAQRLVFLREYDDVCYVYVAYVCTMYLVQHIV